FGRPEQMREFARLEREHDNLQAALAWAEEQLEADLLPRLVTSLLGFWFLHGAVVDGWRWARLAMARADNLSPARRARLLGAAGVVLAFGLGNAVDAAVLFEEALTLFRLLGDEWNAAYVLNLLGLTAGNQGDFVAARRLLEESMERYRAIGDPWGIASGLLDLGEEVWNAGDLDEARDLIGRALPPLRRSGDLWQVIETLVNLGGLALEAGEAERAAGLEREALELLLESGLRWYLPDALEL